MTISTRKARRIRKYLDEGANLAWLGAGLGYLTKVYPPQTWRYKLLEAGWLNERTKGSEL